MKRHFYLLGYLVFAAAAVFAVSASAQSNQNSAPSQGTNAQAKKYAPPKLSKRSFQTRSARRRWTSRSLRNVD